LVGVIDYQEPDINTNVNNEKIFGKHILTLEDLTMITTNNNNSNTITSTQSVNVPWLSQKNSPSRTRKNNRSVRPTTPKTPQKGRATLSRMGATTTRRSQNLQAALEANPIPITTEQTNQEINNGQVDQSSITISLNYKIIILYIFFSSLYYDNKYLFIYYFNSLNKNNKKYCDCLFFLFFKKNFMKNTNKKK